MSDLKVTVTNWGEVALDKRELKALMRSAGNDIKNRTARLINQGQGTGRSYYGPSGRYRASAPGLPPVRVSGDLRSSLKTFVFKSGEGFAVRAREFYSLFLEVGAFGGGRRRGAVAKRVHRVSSPSERAAAALGRGETRVLQPRPFLDRVMDEQAPELERRVRAALTSALKWRETK